MSRKRLERAVSALRDLRLEDLRHASASDVTAALHSLERAMDVAPTNGLTREEKQFVKEGRLINAIKSVRGRTGLGLADAKLFVESKRGES
jgi:ribosomal protein L7/L12